MKTKVSHLGSLALGAGLMYLLDPAKGKRRRAVTRDKLVHLQHKVVEAEETTARDLCNRSAGVRAAFRRVFTPALVSDAVLAERVRSKMGSVVSHPHAIEVSVEQAKVTLTGPILRRELHPLLHVVAGLPGIVEVRNQLDVHDHAGYVSALQGGVRREGTRFEFLQTYWSPTARLAATLAGGAAMVVGIRRRGVIGLTATATGMAILARGLTNLPFRRLIGTSGRRGIDVRKTITIDAPVEDVFAHWIDFANYPRFMEHVREVRDSGHGTLHWVVDGPAGMPVTWDAVITELVPNKRVSWKSLPGVAVEQFGITRFDPTPDGKTRIDIRMSYNPPVGAIGHMVASLLGYDPKHAFDEDLVRFKSLLESGKTTAHSDEVMLADLPGHPPMPSMEVGESAH